jgi:hypothetical protein
MKYEDVFRHRGKSYDLAMKTYPNVRDQEFIKLFHNIPLKENEIILDVASLGGYLKKYCLESNQIISLDFSDAIDDINTVSPYEKWNIPTVDRIVCLATLHHVEHFDAFINNLKSHLSKTGIIHLADVAINNPISKFLDEFVGKYTSTGKHKGIYYDWNQLTFPNDLNVISIENRQCPWFFKSESEMTDFFRLLFDLRNISNNDILIGLKELVGFQENKNNIQLNWNLTYAELSF